jgi:transcriptional regulator with XRE-family HTH domain
MTGDDVKAARRQLGLTLNQLAALLGYSGEQARSQMHHLETERRPLRPAQEKLLTAYLAGYRPKDWPT